MSRSSPGCACGSSESPRRRSPWPVRAVWPRDGTTGSTPPGHRLRTSPCRPARDLRRPIEPSQDRVHLHRARTALRNRHALRHRAGAYSGRHRPGRGQTSHGSSSLPLDGGCKRSSAIVVSGMANPLRAERSGPVTHLGGLDGRRRAAQHARPRAAGRRARLSPLLGGRASRRHHARRAEPRGPDRARSRWPPSVSAWAAAA